MSATATVTSRGRHTVVAVSGEFDVLSFDLLAQALADALSDAAARTRDVVVDLSGVTFMDVRCAGAVVDLDRALRGHGLSLAIEGAPPVITRVIQILMAQQVT